MWNGIVGKSCMDRLHIPIHRICTRAQDLGESNLTSKGVECMWLRLSDSIYYIWQGVLRGCTKVKFTKSPQLNEREGCVVLTTIRHQSSRLSRLKIWCFRRCKGEVYMSRYSMWAISRKTSVCDVISRGTRRYVVLKHEGHHIVKWIGTNNVVKTVWR